jgi:hypothetical protein
VEDLAGQWQPRIPSTPNQRHHGAVNIAFANGRIESVVPERISPSSLRSILTRAGDDPLPIDLWDLDR